MNPIEPYNIDKHSGILTMCSPSCVDKEIEYAHAVKLLNIVGNVVEYVGDILEQAMSSINDYDLLILDALVLDTHRTLDRPGTITFGCYLQSRHIIAYVAEKLITIAEAIGVHWLDVDSIRYKVLALRILTKEVFINILKQPIDD